MHQRPMVPSPPGQATNAAELPREWRTVVIRGPASVPARSVVLHFFHNDPYPILDFRALWSISLDVPSQYDFDFWWNYVEYCRALSTESHLDMRQLDRALWQYSKENQETS